MVKRLYGLTNKRYATKQIANRVRRHEELMIQKEQTNGTQHRTPDSEGETDSDLHYCISMNQNNPIDLYDLTRRHREDAAYEVNSHPH